MAGELMIGETVLTKSGTAKVYRKTFLPEKRKVYNLEVRRHHNFLVGKSGLVVHNACLKDDIIAFMNGPIGHPQYILAYNQDQYWILNDLKSLSKRKQDEFLDVIDGVGELEHYWAFKLLDDLNSSFRFDAVKLGKFSDDIGTVSGLEDFFRLNPMAVKAWKRMLDANVPASMRKNVNALEYVGSPRTNKIKLDVEEALGGHSVARHGHGIPIVEMEQRVLGTHPNLNQSRSALKFDDASIHQSSVDDAFNNYKAEIKAHFDAGGGYKTWGPYETGGRVGEGFHNYSTLSNPTATHVTTSKVNIAFRPDPDHPDGFMLDSAYPKFVP